MTHFSTADHLAEVLDAYGRPADDRVGEITRAAIKHLFAFAEEVGLTREEWLAGIEFLTAVGHKSDDQRQEFILLSDTLGLSMLVEMINQKGAEGTTDPTVFGPFHVPGAPMLAMGESILVDDDPGPELTFRGTVRNLDGSVLDGAELDVWQGASNGLYNVQDADQSDINLRGRFLTGARRPLRVPHRATRRLPGTRGRTRRGDAACHRPSQLAAGAHPRRRECPRPQDGHHASVRP